MNRWTDEPANRGTRRRCLHFRRHRTEAQDHLCRVCGGPVRHGDVCGDCLAAAYVKHR